MRILVLGASGLIGSASARALRAAGHDVTGLGRGTPPAGMGWIAGDLRRMGTADWARAVDGVDAVVNAAGVLQDGGADDLEAVHVTAVESLVAALGDRLLVQVSAVGAGPNASTAFMATKGRGDAIVRTVPRHVILRPGLVIGAAAYGGTALLRAAAALPFGAHIFPNAPIQTVALDDVALAIVLAIEGQVPPGTEADLVETQARPLPQVIAALRAWLGLPPFRIHLPVPGPALALLGRIADGLSFLGWRAPLRSTALRVLEGGVTGDPTRWAAAGGSLCRSLDETLASLPSTVQERWFARAWPMVPACVAGLSVFWLLSGIIGAARLDAAMEVLTARGHGTGFARAAVLGGAVCDVVLGAAILWRPWARAACLGMAGVAAAYLIGGTVLTPGLWLDPLGPLVKIGPVILLALLTRALLETR